MKISFLSLFTLLLLINTACSNSNRDNPRDLSEEDQNIDQVLAEATFTDLEGEEISIDDFEGKIVLFDFWETWCGPCLQVFPALDSLQNEYPDNFVVVTVNLNESDTPEDVEAFRDEHEYDFVYAIDTEKVGSEIIRLGIPFKVFMDENGYLIETELGSAGTEGDYQKAKEIIEQNKTS